jgi:superfamily II DNA/RNA helicase
MNLCSVGRAGRFGRKGFAITLVADSELIKLEAIEKFYEAHVPETQLTSLTSVLRFLVLTFLQSILIYS